MSDNEQTEDITLAEAQAADAGLPQEPTEEVEEEKDPLANVPEDLRGYVQGFWHGRFPNFQCDKHRGFKTVDAETFRNHLDKVHALDWLEGV